MGKYESTYYEWVVETVNDDGDIEDCDYWDEAHYAQAIAQRDSLRASEDRPGYRIDFGLCWNKAAGGYLDRLYAYQNADGSWPTVFRDPVDGRERDIPKRLLAVVARAA